MATLSVESDSLRTNAEKMIKLANRVNSIHDRFVNVRRTLDWDVMGEAQLEGKISHLLGELNLISKKLNEAGSALQDIENEYTATHNEMMKLVCELPDTVNQLSNGEKGMEIGSETGSPAGSSIFPSLGPVFGNMGSQYDYYPGASLFDNVTFTGPNFEILNGNKKLVEGYLMKGEMRSEIGLLSGNTTVKVGGGAVTATAKSVLFGDGKLNTTDLLEVGINAKAYAINGETKIQYGNDEFNVNVAGEGHVCVAEAKGGILISGEGIGVGGEVGAAVLKGEVKGGFTLFGISIDASIEGEVLGVGAGVGFMKEKNSLELSGKLSALLGAGVKLKISW